MPTKIEWSGPWIAPDGKSYPTIEDAESAGHLAEDLAPCIIENGVMIEPPEIDLETGYPISKMNNLAHWAWQAWAALDHNAEENLASELALALEDIGYPVSPEWKRE